MEMEHTTGPAEQCPRCIAFAEVSLETEHPTGPPEHSALARQLALCEIGRHGEMVAHENLMFCAVCGRAVAEAVEVTTMPEAIAGERKFIAGKPIHSVTRQSNGTLMVENAEPEPPLASQGEAREVARRRLEHVENVIRHAQAEIRRYAELIADAYELKAKIRLGLPADGQLTSALKSGSVSDMTQTAKLSEAAQAALINAESRQGAQVKAAPGVMGELLSAGLIGFGDGLTRKGTIARQAVLSAKLDAAF